MQRLSKTLEKRKIKMLLIRKGTCNNKIKLK